MIGYSPEGLGARQRLINPTEDSLNKAINSGDVFEGTVIKCSRNMELMVDLGKSAYGVIVRDEHTLTMNGEGPKDIAVLACVGKSVAFKLLSYSTDISGKRRVMLSRRAAQEDCMNNYVSRLTVGEIITVKKTHVEDYGLFCDIGCGISGLLPIENFSVSRINNPKKWLVGAYILRAVVKEIDSKGRLILSHKELLGTWEEEAAKFDVDDIVIGTVRAIVPYGVFIELTPNLTGLAEPNENDNVEIDSTVSVHVKSLNSYNMKVKLNIVNVIGNGVPANYLTSLDYSKTSGHISSWVYSPASCERVIATEFN